MNWEPLLLYKLSPCSGELLVNFNVFMSGDLTGLCLYMQDVFSLSISMNKLYLQKNVTFQNVVKILLIF